MSIIGQLNRKALGVLRSDQSSKFFAPFTCFFSTKLKEVGILEEQISDKSTYPSGQSFVHKIFGYRGIILFPWHATVYDGDLKDDINKTSSIYTSTPGKYKNGSQSDSINIKTAKKKLQKTSDNNNNADKSDGVDPSRNQSHVNIDKQMPYCSIHPYYQVLIDDRDAFHVSNRTQIETELSLSHPDRNGSVYLIRGLDYVAHEDIMPYSSHEKVPIQHELFNKLFAKSHTDSSSKIDRYKPSKTLHEWRGNHRSLKLSKVYKKTTENIRITVIPFYLGHFKDDDSSNYWWRYCIRLQNLGETTVQLRERSWKIFSEKNMIETVKGRGVNGIEPQLTAKEPAYQYSSHVALQNTSGQMWGTFRMERSDDIIFDCQIPSFSLESSLSD